MRALGAARSLLLAGLLCLACAPVALALATPTRSSHRRSSHTARACHRKHTSVKPTTPAAGTGGSSAPVNAPPAAPGVGSTTAGGTLPSNPVSEAPQLESPTAPTGPVHVQVTAEDSEAFRFVLSRPSVPAGKVIVEFVNHGQDEHNLNALEQSEGTIAGSLPNTAPNAHPTLTLTLKPGSYTLFCSLPGHEAKGMKATLLVN
jgi:plastocyanin